jgi:hypothetical protein
MNRSLQSFRLALILCAGLVLQLAASPLQAAQTAYSGRAFAAYVNTAVTGPIFLSDTGPLSPAGGHQGASLLTANVPGVLSAEVLTGSTSGGGGTAHSSASLAEAVVFPGQPYQVTASFVRAETRASCDSVSGSSQIADLTFGGQSVTVSGAPNQTVRLPGGLATLIINEQNSSSSGNTHEINVNAIHLIVPGVGEVILSGAHSDITCHPNTPKGPCHDFVTGGGWIVVGGSKGNFGFHAGLKGDGSPAPVHLNYVDHNTGMKVRAKGMTSYVATSPTCRRVTGPCEINGQSGFTYTVEVCDNGEPGRHTDTFMITLSNGYSAGGVLDGGNIQLHAPCQGKP